MAAVFVKAYIDYSKAGFNYSSPILGIQLPIFIGIGGLLLGVPLMLLASLKYREFFQPEARDCRRDALDVKDRPRRAALLAMQPTVSPGAALPWWIEDALAQEGERVDSPPLAGRPRRRRRDRRRWLHGSLDRARAARTRPVGDGRRARGGVLRRRPERPERRLHRGLLAGRRRAAQALRRRGRRPARDRRRGYPAGRARARRGRLAARGGHADGRDDGAPGSGRRPRVATAASLGRPEQAVPLSQARGGRTLRIAALSPRRALPGHRHRASRQARARAPPRGARARRDRCTRERA